MNTLSRLACLFGILVVIVACGGGGGAGTSGAPGGSGNVVNPNPDNPPTPVSPSSTTPWTSGVFLPASTYHGYCAIPVPGSGDIQGTRIDENNFLRSHSNHTYLWYDEIIDRDPAFYSTPTYFDLLKTSALTPSGNPKDNFHFSIPTDEWESQSQSGVSVGYGAQFAIVQPDPPRLVMVAYTEPGTPAVAPGANLVRGVQVLTVDGVNVANTGNTAVLNAAFFPQTAGETHVFTVRDPNGTVRSFSMQSAVITSAPVLNMSTIPIPGGKAGYLLFNDHIATAEGQLYDAITQLAAAGITELVLDLRYNGGGFLDIASELAYMIAGPVPTAGRTFEALRFNNKHPLFNPVTGRALTPVPFHTRSLGIDPVLPSGTLLPTLNLSRVYVLTGQGTCSASESIINGLRGVDVNVVQVGSTTCGKPYGFYPADNCGTTYFTIQFQGVNAKGFGNYSDGFSPANATGSVGTVLPGCSVRDDFTAALGNPAEARLAAALTHIQTGGCPVASGFSAPSLSRFNATSADEEVSVPKSAWQQNRIMRP